jgi:hypothetical protein
MNVLKKIKKGKSCRGVLLRTHLRSLIEKARNREENKNLFFKNKRFRICA